MPKRVSMNPFSAVLPIAVCRKMGKGMRRKAWIN
jgi:hypothetical protein